MDATRLQRIRGAVRHYAWGSRTAIPELLGEPPTSEPQAELWLGAHPAAPAQLQGEREVPLDAWIRADPEGVLGAPVVERFGAELPFLLKVLAAAEPLSIQAHPDAAQARAGFARENAAGLALDAPERCYRDPHPKPELICALTPFRALNRFREPERIAEGIAALAGSELGSLLAPLRARPDREGLAAFLEGWLAFEPAARERLLAEIATRAGRADPGDPALAELCRLARDHPGDPGVLAPLFLNWVELAPGEAMFLPPGELHSYLGGTGIVLMASSDNVLRGGLTRKHVDVPELLATLSFASGPVERLRPEVFDRLESRYRTLTEEFALSLLRLRSGEVWRSPLRRGVEILLCTEGRIELSAGSHSLALARGGSAIAPAATGNYRATGEGVVYRAAVGLDFG
jgi:mannose-6-phosphate isomerase